MSDGMTQVQTDMEEMTADAASESNVPRDVNEEFVARVEALLFVADKPLADARIVDLLEIEFADEAGEARLKALQQVRDSIDTLNAEYTRTKRAFRIIQVAGGWQVMTMPEHGELLKRLRGDRQLSRLTPAALETLAIVAYRQPILRADLEAIRGVACGEVLRGLLSEETIGCSSTRVSLQHCLYGFVRIPSHICTKYSIVSNYLHFLDQNERFSQRLGPVIKRK